MVILHKDKKGQQWFAGIYSNNFEDNDSETFSWDSHVEYAEWVKEKGVKFPLTVLHQPQYPIEVHLAQFIGLANGTFSPKEFSDNYMKMYSPYAFAQTEAIIPINGFTLVIAKVLDNKKDVVELLDKSSWRMSHGYLMLGQEKSTIEQYRTFEFTSLPPALAANSITVTSFQENMKMDELKGLKKEDKEVIKKVLNASPEEIENATEEAQAVLQKVLDSKQVDTEVDESGEEYESIREKIFSDLGVEELQQFAVQMVKELKEVKQELEKQSKRLKVTEITEDEKIASQFDKPSWTFSEKGSEDHLTEEETEALKEKALGEGKIEGMPELTPSSTDPIEFTWKTLAGLR